LFLFLSPCFGFLMFPLGFIFSLPQLAWEKRKHAYYCDARMLVVWVLVLARTF
jgi:hypothetical protein